MAKSKVDPDALRQFLADGHTQADVARHLGVSQPAITQRLKRLRLPTSRAARAVVTAEPELDTPRPDPDRLREVIEGRLDWAVDQARRDGADVVDTVHRLAADIRRDLAVHLALAQPADQVTSAPLAGSTEAICTCST